MKFLETIAQYVEEKVSDYGASVIAGFVAGSPIGDAITASSKFAEIVETGGLSEINELTTTTFKQFTFKVHGFPLLQKLQDAVMHPDKTIKLAPWQRTNWATSRQQWLTDQWKHDWRSQPRNRIGEWIPGRLPYPAISAKQVGKGKQRTSRERRRINRYRRYGRAAARSLKNGD